MDMSRSDPIMPERQPPAPKLPDVDSPPTEDVLHGVPSKEEIIEDAKSAEEIVEQQPSPAELLGRDR
jgi:hypothetical protein